MEPDQLDDPVLYRQELIKVHGRRLKVLEIQASKYGLECPASIQVEIIEIKEKIAELGGEVDTYINARKFIKKFKEDIAQNKGVYTNGELLNLVKQASEYACPPELKKEIATIIALLEQPDME